MAHLRTVQVDSRLKPVTVGDQKLIDGPQGRCQLLDGFVTNFQQKLYAPGATKSKEREVIFFDPTDHHYATLYLDLASKISKEKLTKSSAIIQRTIQYVQECFTGAKGTIDATIEKYKMGLIDQQPVVPLYGFYLNGGGVCRHHALLTAFFLDSLIKNNLLPKGKVFYHRDNVPLGAHVWNMYQKENGELELIDSQWNVYTPFSLHCEILKVYGIKALQECEKRYFTKKEAKLPDLKPHQEKAPPPEEKSKLSDDFIEILQASASQIQLKLKEWKREGRLESQIEKWNTFCREIAVPIKILLMVPKFCEELAKIMPSEATCVSAVSIFQQPDGLPKQEWSGAPRLNRSNSDNDTEK